MRTSKKRFFQTFFAIHCYMWAVVATVGILDAMRTSPVNSSRIALCLGIILVGVGLGTLLIRRPRL
jgi:hypothetical protein